MANGRAKNTRTIEISAATALQSGDARATAATASPLGQAPAGAAVYAQVHDFTKSNSALAGREIRRVLHLAAPQALVIASFYGRQDSISASLVSQAIQKERTA